MCQVGRTANQVQIHQLFFIFIVAYPAIAFYVLFVSFDNIFKKLPDEIKSGNTTTYGEMYNYRTATFTFSMLACLPMITLNYYNIHQQQTPITTPAIINV